MQISKTLNWIWREKITGQCVVLVSVEFNITEGTFVFITLLKKF